MISKIIEWCGKNRLFVSLGLIFVIGWGFWAVKTVPLDAIPDLSDTQVVVFAQWDRSPDILEDQVAYPISRALLGAPHVKAIRAQSDFGFSYVYVIFDEGTDVYWARSRVLEHLSKIQGSLPEGAKVEIGPDATGVGWVYQYALVDKTGQHSLQELKSYQDWNLKFVLQSLPGVAEVSTVGGETKEYQVEVNPAALAAYDMPFADVVKAIRESNQEVGGRLLEMNGTEYMVRGLGYVRGLEDIQNVVIGRDKQGVSILLRDVGQVQLGPALRRNVTDLNGQGEVVGGIVTMRYGENAMNVIQSVKQKLEELKPSLPQGVEIVPVYDRSELIQDSVNTLMEELAKLAIAVSIVCLVFLWNLPSAFVILVTLPVAILISFICMKYIGVTSNIMSLGGIAIAIGAMVDASIIMVENACKRLEEWEKGDKKEDRTTVILHACQEVGPSLFMTLLVITAGFLPVFALQGQEGRLFKPLAFTKTFSMFFAAFLAITVTPMLMTFLLRGKIRPESENPVNRFLQKVYAPVARWVLDQRMAVILSAVVIMLFTLLPISRLGSEFMPSLWEETLLYMPITLPGVSIAEAGRLLEMQDRVIKDFPEVQSVFGKVGRAETSLDPAPLSMVETTIVFKPESQWPKGTTHEKLIQQMDQALQIPGYTNDWIGPIKNRIDMLSTGIRTPIGIKVLGDSFDTIEKTSEDIEKAVRDIPGTRSAFAERVTGGYFVDIVPKRDQLARYGMSVGDLNDFIQSAIGGDMVTETVEGRARYAVTVRLSRDFRDTPDKISRVPLVTPTGQHIQLGQVADVGLSTGPGMIRDENGLLAGYVYVDLANRDPGSWVADAKKIVERKVSLPPGVSLVWSGQYEYMEQAAKRLKVMIPLTLLLVFLLIYFNTKSFTETVIVLLAVPFSLVGAFWLLWILGYNLSVAVAVGMIALAGLDAETGVVMLLYLNISYREYEAKGRLKNLKDLREAAFHGAVHRVRPKMMTVGAAWMGLVPILFSNGVGSDVMKRIAAPMVGGVFTSFALELLVYPVIFVIWKWHTEVGPRVEKRELKGFAKWFWACVKKVG
jgi:Cu(I)/Ag(I) efflux system membrane protein CusA/SilA